VDNQEDRDNKLKVTILVEEYRALRAEIRMLEVLATVSGALAILTIVTMFIASLALNQEIIVFLAPMVSLLFVIIALIVYSFSTSVGILASEVEDSLNELSGEQLMKWELRLGPLFGKPKDFILKRISKFWLEVTILGLGIVAVVVLIALVYEFDNFYEDVGYVAWIIFALDVGTTLAVYILGFSFVTGTWRRIKT
jgi:Fe2+ transport system protein B